MQPPPSLWEIRYRKDGKEGSIVREWPERPSDEYAAIMLRKALLPEVMLIPDTPRDIKEKTLYQINKLGIELVSIEIAEP